MRKKYLAIILSMIMCSSVFFTGCGKTADENVIEEDEDDEDEDDEKDKDDDDDKEEDDKPSERVIVKEIDDKTLESQIDIFLKGRDTWVIPNEQAVMYESTGYMLSDLDYNGRTELIVSFWEGMGTHSTVYVYEINEKGDGFDLLDWEFKGIDSDQKVYPDVAYFSAYNGYYDKENGIFHYLFRDYYAYSFTSGGCRYHDVSLVDGKVITEVYAKSESNGSDGDEVDTFYGPDGEMDETEYVVYISNYPWDYDTKELWLGIFNGDSAYSRYENIVEYMVDEQIKDILTDSYHLFIRKLSYEDFFERHIASNDPAQTSEELFNASVGSWGLYMTDAEGCIEYYDADTPYYTTLDVYDDWTIHLDRYLNTEYEHTIDLNLLEKADGQLMAQYSPPASAGMAYDLMVLTFVTIDDDGLLVVSCESWWGNEHYPGSTWYFQRLD